MKPRDCFRVGIRLIGVWSILLGLPEFVSYVDIKLNLFKPVASQPMSYLIHSAVYFIFGFYLLSGGEFLTNIAFPQDPGDEEKKEADKPNGGVPRE